MSRKATDQDIIRATAYSGASRHAIPFEVAT